jgi:peptidoglycan LD-endopeptidase CwlK
MAFTWSQRSLKNMEGLHPDLRKVCDLALQLSPLDFTIIGGRRSLAQQRIYVKQGKSQTMNSRHLYGLAVDYCGAGGSFDAKVLRLIAGAFKEAAKQLDIPITWGGDWKGFVDDDHIELAKSKYPNNWEK